MENWNNVPLGQVLNYEQPTKYIVETTDYNSSYETPVLTAGKSFVLGYTNEKNGIFTDVPAIIFDDFTTAFHYVDFPFKVKSSAMKILKADKEKADLRFLYHRMSKISIDTDLHKRYWISKFSKAQIQLPPLETQKRIAQILDDAAALRLKTEQLLKEYDLLAKSIFLDMFGDPAVNPKEWAIIKLGDICGVGSSRRVFVNELVDNGIPFYRGKEVGILSVDNIIESDLFITKEHYEKLMKETGVPKIGDLLMPSICPDGRILRVSNNEPFYFKDGRVLWIKIDELTINSFYLKTFLKELFFTNYTNIASGTTFAELKIFALKKIKLLAPPLSLQNQFGEKITSIEKQKELAKQELKESENLFNCLLQKAFKGELV